LSIPPELATMMAGGAGKGPGAGEGPLDAAAKTNSPPSAGPMTTPQPKEGLEQAATIKIAMVFQMLEQALPAFGSPTPKGKAIVSAIRTLTTAFGADRGKAEQLIPAELAELTSSVSGAGGGSPAAQAMGAQPPLKPAMPSPGASA
jgi:hypothetical protein